MSNYRNPRILALARDHSCQFCGADDGTVVAAHGNGARFGKGLGIKSHDIPAFLCMKCHAFVDSGSADKATRDHVWREALLKSIPLYWELLNDQGKELAKQFGELA